MAWLCTHFAQALTLVVLGVHDFDRSLFWSVRACREQGGRGRRVRELGVGVGLGIAQGSGRVNQHSCDWDPVSLTGIAASKSTSPLNPRFPAARQVEYVDEEFCFLFFGERKQNNPNRLWCWEMRRE